MMDVVLDIARIDCCNACSGRRQNCRSSGWQECLWCRHEPGQVEETREGGDLGICEDRGLSQDGEEADYVKLKVVELVSP